MLFLKIFGTGSFMLLTLKPEVETEQFWEARAEVIISFWVNTETGAIFYLTLAAQEDVLRILKVCGNILQF